ncbi:MAG: leucyl aminopeptidase [Clostridium sp.]
MNIFIKEVELSSVDAMIIPVFEDYTVECGELAEMLDKVSFKGKKNEVFYITEVDSKVRYKILVGLGKHDDATGEVVRDAMAKAARQCRDLGVKEAGVNFFRTDKICIGGRVKSIAEGIALGLYTFNKFKSEKKEYTCDFYITGVPAEKLEKANERLKEVINIIDGTILARNLVNEPSNHLYPEAFAGIAAKQAKACGIECEILDEIQCEELGMEAFLAVAKGSARKPRLVVLRYLPNKEDGEILGLIGKGLTYDTGGYSIKPSDSMKDMKSDMGGAASVLGVMTALAKNKVNKNVIAVIAACENAISGEAYKPGDIIGSMGGKTIEVLNTDAEGRLTLADAVTYAIQKENVSKVIDVATLTGAALVALGETTTAVVSNNDEFYEDLEKAAKVTGEKFWRLPAFPEYKELIKGSLADLKNIGGKNAGTITAGLFVGEFVCGKPWLHLDIAGTAWTANPVSQYTVKGGTGVPVRTLYYLVKGPCGCKH